jgi:hypothetical protein
MTGHCAPTQDDPIAHPGFRLTTQSGAETGHSIVIVQGELYQGRHDLIYFVAIKIIHCFSSCHPYRTPAGEG